MKMFDFKNINHLKLAICKKSLGSGGSSDVKLFQCKEIHNNNCKEDVSDNDSDSGSVEECDKTFVVKQLHTNVGYWNKEDMIEKLENLNFMLLNEYNIGMMLDHPNIIKTLDIDEKAYSLILEHVIGIDILDYLNLHGCKDSVFLLKHFYTTLKALEYMHNIGVAHMDIKLENILLDIKNDNVKLIDLGHSKIFKKDGEYIPSNRLCGTEGYFPPEYYNQLEFMPDKVDIWCCGIVLYNLIFDCMPWEYASKNKDQLYYECYQYLKFKKLHPNHFSYKKYKMPDLTKEDFNILNNIFISVFSLNPSERPTVSKLLKMLSEISLIKNLNLIETN
jgi:serine/threonine protein kinase